MYLFGVIKNNNVNKKVDTIISSPSLYPNIYKPAKGRAESIINARMEIYKKPNIENKIDLKESCFRFNIIIYIGNERKYYFWLSNRQKRQDS